jgi:hypothetical protein
MAEGSTTTTCTFCGKGASELCARCKSLSYCSKECQTADWKVHKLLCATLKMFTAPPESDLRRAVLFPQDDDAPKWVWIIGEFDGDQHNPNALQNILNNALPNPHDQANTFPRLDRLLRNDVRGRTPQHTLFMVSRKDFQTDGSRLNKSVAKVTNGQMKIQWRGPIVFMARKGQATTEPAVSILPAQQLSDSEDMTTHDFRDVVDILSTYARTDAAISKLMPARIAKGVRINCPGDMSATGQPRYVAAEVHTSMPVFVTSSLNCNIPFILGLPLCAQQLPLDGDWRHDTSKTTNLPLLWLHFQVTGAATMIGNIPKLGFDKGGSALVVRAGGEDLLQEHLEVMCEFCSSVVDRVQSAMQRGDKKRIQQFAEKNVTKEKYLAYWEDYQATKASTEEHWKDLPSPYDMELDMEDFRREIHPPFRAFKPDVILHVD